jgi:hypothetical protein
MQLGILKYKYIKLLQFDKIKRSGGRGKPGRTL